MRRQYSESAGRQEESKPGLRVPASPDRDAHGGAHVELTCTPPDNDCFIDLLGPVAKGASEWRTCPGTHRQGFPSLWPGREAIDYAVPEVLNDELVDEGVRGDTYQVVVQAANATSRFRLSGYTPRAGPGSLDTTGDESFTRVARRTPAKVRAWRTPRIPARARWLRRRALCRRRSSSTCIRCAGRTNPGSCRQSARHVLALGSLRAEPARGDPACRGRLVRPAGRLHDAGGRPLEAATHVSQRARPLAGLVAVVRRGAGRAGGAGDGAAHGGLRGDAPDPTEPAARERDQARVPRCGGADAGRAAAFSRVSTGTRGFSTHVSSRCGEIAPGHNPPYPAA